MPVKLRLSKPDLLQLFLFCALPVHFWTIITIFMDTELMLTKRDLWYGAGFAGYLLVFALLESIVFFAFILALTFLFPKSWDKRTALVMAAVIAGVLAFWALSNQAYFMLINIPVDWVVWLRLRLNYRQNLAHPLLALAVLGSAALPLVLVPRSKNAQKIVSIVVEKLSFLSPIYLLIDLLGFAAAVLRNIY